MRAPGRIWTESELSAVHARYLAGEHASSLAKIRGRTSAELLFMFTWRGWALRERAERKMPPRIAPEIVAAMHADYETGMTFAQVERKHGRPAKSIRTIFLHRGLPIRDSSKRYSKFRLADGSFAPLIPKTPEEIEALVQAATKITIPDALNIEWRKWDMARRADFIARLRVKLASPLDRPDKPFSTNVVPFDYGSAEAWKLVRAKNDGKTSRYAAAKMDIRSQGVIYQGELWFWNFRGRGYFRGQPWTPENGRPSLHRWIWQQTRGAIPAAFVVSMADGNPNNFDPANLILRTREEMLRTNQATSINRKSRESVNLLLNRTQKPNENDLLRRLACR
ncbi:MAG: HNH endonuclease signature motif containing protein [Luteolibacter sp.]|uniref:HNH endonuclease signature motif containing protein n=1 Tax=Luteolibacter sp. TaxID=1962973 RepID=UPI003265BFFC